MSKKKSSGVAKTAPARPPRNQIPMIAVGLVIARFIQTGYLSYKMASAMTDAIDREYINQLRLHKYPLPPLAPAPANNVPSVSPEATPDSSVGGGI